MQHMRESDGLNLLICPQIPAVPEEADALVLDLYDRLPAVRITDLLLEVDDEIAFTDAFMHLRTGSPC